MRQYNLDRIFQPRRVAVVGASKKKPAASAMMMSSTRF
jgi:acyl-CoA synthetase (NDP forming)